jgi:hypothetical protein
MNILESQKFKMRSCFSPAPYRSNESVRLFTATPSFPIGQQPEPLFCIAFLVPLRATITLLPALVAQNGITVIVDKTRPADITKPESP